MDYKNLLKNKKKIAGIALICTAVVIASVSLFTTLSVNNARKASLREYQEEIANEGGVVPYIEEEGQLPQYDIKDEDIENMREQVLKITEEGGTPEEKAEKLLEYSRENNLPAAVKETETVDMPVNYAANSSSKKEGSSTKKTGTTSKTNGSTTSKTSNSNSKKSSTATKKSLGTTKAKNSTSKTTTVVKAIPDGTILGIINIPSIACRETIKEGTTDAVLKSAVGHMDGTSYPGFPGNSVLMGHRNYTFGMFFNRLNEVKAGDLVTVETNGITRTYMVYATYVVTPDDYSVAAQTGLNEVTLITCTPIYVATHRLIVKAVLVG